MGSKAELSKYQPVRLHGLVGAAHLNDLVGYVTENEAAGDRWPVKFTTGKVVSAKPKNLVDATGVPGKSESNHFVVNGKLLEFKYANEKDYVCYSFSGETRQPGIKTFLETDWNAPRGATGRPPLVSVIFAEVSPDDREVKGFKPGKTLLKTRINSLGPMGAVGYVIGYAQFPTHFTDDDWASFLSQWLEHIRVAPFSVTKVDTIIFKNHKYVCDKAGVNAGFGEQSEPKSSYRITQKDTVQKKMNGPARSRSSGRQDKAIIVSLNDIQKIKDMSTIETPQEAYAKKMAALEEREKVQKKAMERKKKILSLEEVRKSNRIMSDMEKEEIVNRNGCLQRAHDLLAEQQDAVKEMNQMVNYAKTVTIRDAQLQEKQYIMQERKEEEAQAALVMEIERLKACKMYEEREKQRKEDQRRGAQVIVLQIKENQSRRQREEAHRAQER
eukprot:gene19-934_t